MDLQNTKVAVLGAGQLSRMLVLAGQNLGLECHVFAKSQDEPAAQVTPYYHLIPQALLNPSQASSDKLYQWILTQVPNLKFLTFESEFLTLTKNTNTNSALSIFPSPENMALLQYRQQQKALLEIHKIPSAPYVLINNQNECEKILAEYQKNKSPLVFKTCFGGYDGYGTFFLKKAEDCDLIRQQAKNTPMIAEPMIKFENELALIAVRSQKNNNSKSQTVYLPLVQTKQVHGRCDWVYGPYQHPSLLDFQKKFSRFLNAIDYVGCMGIELFDCRINGKRQLWVNELAPRVHNSGHYSQNALDMDQFTAHWLAGLGMKLNTPRARTNQFAMINLLGQSSDPILVPDKLGSDSLATHLHLYGKKENRRGRKMGHINLTSDAVQRRHPQTPEIIAEGLKIRRRFRL